VDSTARTFTLTATWAKIVTAIKLADLPAKLTGYLIEVSAPGGGFSIPLPGTIQLSGGAPSAAATPAAATVLASG
jgi:hypothetical protein